MMRLNNYPIITDRRLKVGVVGCGRISKNHFGSILQYPEELELAAFCDIDGNAVKQAAEEYNAQGYTELRDMLINDTLDLVVSCTPSGLHPSQTILAAEHGVHVVSEKPMATRYNDGLRMVQACDEAGVRLFVVKQNRRNATLQLLKRAIDEKRLGAIKMVHLNVFWTRPQDYYDHGQGWRGS